MARIAKVVIVVALLAVGGYMMARHFAPDGRTDEQIIYANLSAIQMAVEEKSVRKCMDHVSEAYSDPVCESKRALMRLCYEAFRENGRFTCLVQPERPDVHGDRATVDLQVDFSIDYGSKVNEEGPFLVRTTWAKEDGDWLMVGAEGYMNAQGAWEM